VDGNCVTGLGSSLGCYSEWGPHFDRLAIMMTRARNCKVKVRTRLVLGLCQCGMLRILVVNGWKLCIASLWPGQVTIASEAILSYIDHMLIKKPQCKGQK
jgi:hypothetical protein